MGYTHGRLACIGCQSFHVWTITTIPLVQSPLCLLLLVRLGGYIVNLCAFYSYKLIGKLTAFLQLQEFVSAIRPWIFPLPPRGFLYPAQKQSWSGSC